jgi:hypothetical protein
MVLNTIALSPVKRNVGERSGAVPSLQKKFLEIRIPPENHREKKLLKQQLDLDQLFLLILSVFVVSIQHSKASAQKYRTSTCHHSEPYPLWRPAPLSDYPSIILDRPAGL